MEKYLLDTNICIFLKKGNKDVGDRLYEIGVNNCYISEITKAELLFGAFGSKQEEKELAVTNKLISLFKVIPISDAITVFARQKARLKKAGTPVSDFDLLIGSTAIAHGYVMVTDNLKDFMPQEGIRLENWVKR